MIKESIIIIIFYNNNNIIILRKKIKQIKDKVKKKKYLIIGKSGAERQHHLNITAPNNSLPTRHNRSKQQLQLPKSSVPV